ncbi:MAG: hypothetical protein ABW224_10720 [Kibdelosporangium sp.]
MARNRPGALRAAQFRPRAWVEQFPARIHGLSSRTSTAIRQAETLDTDVYLYSGATDLALRRYRAFLRPAGHRPLYPRNAECPAPDCSLDDVRHARDLLDEILRLLPCRARAELGRQVAALDAVYLTRTLPDPFADRQWKSDHWWRRRLTADHGTPGN